PVDCRRGRCKYKTTTYSPVSTHYFFVIATNKQSKMVEKKQASDGGPAIVSVDPKPQKGIAATLVDFLENLIVKFGHDSTLPLHYLSGNFAPSNESPPAKDLLVKGHLPECLNGEFVRVGPNPKLSPVAGYHWFDGDGYVSLSLTVSSVSGLQIGDLKGFFGLFMVNIQTLRAKLKVLDFSYGNGTANTALIYHHGKLLALSEADKPYVVKIMEDGDLQTIGLLDYDKRLKHSFTAHPKVDPFTENYAIFMDLPLYFRPKEMVKEKKFIFSFDETKKARFGILPRYAKDDLMIKWFELPNCFIFHNANAWEEEDEVVLITCRLENPDLDMVNGAVKEKLENFANELYEMRFNMNTGVASQKKLSASAVDFPRINESYTGRKQRYVYGTILDSIAKVTGIIKVDLHGEPQAADKTKLEVGGNIKGIFDLGPGRYGSEAIFVPREPGVTSEEDDGYLIFFSHDENTGKSAVIVIDAKTMSPDPVAVVELPHRVPYGFHAFFVTEPLPLEEVSNSIT
ncbi:Carotenoid 9,10(9',10')-cleavage dioxygenase 1, partial [Linum perenne]